MAGGEKTNVRGKGERRMLTAGARCRLICTAGGPGSENERLQSCGFSDLCVCKNIQRVGSDAPPASMTCCPLSRGKKKINKKTSKSKSTGVGGSEVCSPQVCGCQERTYIGFGTTSPYSAAFSCAQWLQLLQEVHTCEARQRVHLSYF